MFILLPEKEKKDLYKEYRLRALSVFCLFLSAVFLINSALVIPGALIVSSEKNSILDQNTILEKQIDQKNKEGLLSTLDIIKSNARIARPDTTNITEVLEALSSVKPSGITIQNISYTRGVGAPSSLALDGVALDRQDLIDFTNALKKQKNITDVSLPLTNLAKGSNAKFTIAILGKF